MLRTLTVARREFLATVLTKGFLFGVLIVPVLALGGSTLAMTLIKTEPPPVRGTVAIIDRSVTPGGSPRAAAANVAAKLAPDAIAQRLRRDVRDGLKEAAKAAERLAPAAGQRIGAAGAAVEDALERRLPTFDVVVIDAGDSEESARRAADEAKRELLLGSAFDGGRLAVVVVDPDAVARAPGRDDFGRFELTVRPRLDARVQGVLRTQVRDGVVDARLAANGQDPAMVRDLMRLDAPDAKEYTPEGKERRGGELQQMLVPLGFMMLLWISTFTGGQYLLASTIEEKSSRVMEVLLSAVSPMQLMTGKIIGQMGAGLLVLVAYSGLGGTALALFGMAYLLTPGDLALLAVFFFIAFFTIASLMAAVGSAVTDIHEAQTLLTPVMLIILTPMLLMMPIIWNPGGVLATTLSFVPPINPFVMVLRLSSGQPPPAWQTALSILIGAGAVYLMLRGAAKIFRIGCLMYGKPPNLPTLVKWLRMA